jgi:hypothetical protein
MRAGFAVTLANAGPLLKSAARNHAPDLILLSPVTGPPGASEIARGIKEDPETRSIPIVHVIDGRRYDEISRLAYPTEAQVRDDADDEEIMGTMRMVVPRVARVRIAASTRSHAAPLEGDLESDTFPEVLQFLFATSKSGRISIRDGYREGRIFVEEGQVVHAEIGRRSGLEAFQEMCFSTKGHFRFEPNVATIRKTMRHDGIGLLLESARQKDVLDRDGAPALVTPAPAAALDVVAPRVVRRPADKDLFTAALPESAPRGRQFPAGVVVVLVSAILLFALGVYAWTGG